MSTVEQHTEQPTKAYMGQKTRAYIGQQNEDGTVTAIYIHFNGSLTDTGTALPRFYNDREKVASLLPLGNLAVLGATPEHSEAYRRDWNLEGEEAEVYCNATAFEQAAQVYAQRYDEHCHAYLQKRSGEWHVAWGYGKNGSVRWPQLAKFLKRAIWMGL